MAYKDPEKQRAFQRDRQRKKRIVLKEVILDLKCLGCLYCGELEPSCLDFHHVDPAKKSFTIGSTSPTRTPEAVIAESKECIVLCANCHRKLHAGVIKIAMLEKRELSTHEPGGSTQHVHQ